MREPVAEKDSPLRLDYADRHSDRRQRWFWVIWVLPILLLVFMALVIALPKFNRRSERPPRLTCASQLRQIALACIIYSKQSGGRFPDSVATLYETTDLSPEAFVCPDTNHRPATGATAQSIARVIASSPPPNAPGCRCSYIYVGAGLTDKSPATAIALYEPPSNHGGVGGNVVYADGHQEWHDAKTLATIIPALTAGQNPPP